VRGIRREAEWGVVLEPPLCSDCRRRVFFLAKWLIPADRWCKSYEICILPSTGLRNHWFAVMPLLVQADLPERGA
jgi:hypothetical protein